MFSVFCFLCWLSASLAMIQPARIAPWRAEVLPVWHTQFSVHFNETMKILYFQTHTTGTWYYDAVAQAEVIDRKNGQGDRYCGSIHPFTKTPCRHLVLRGNRYLIFPQLKQCCLCCVAAQGCGILHPRWLDDAEFLGKENMYGKEVYKWNKKGLQDNLYYATADDDQVPVELDQVPNDRQTFDTDTFARNPIDPSRLSVPCYCKPRCPFTSVCSLLHGPDHNLFLQSKKPAVQHHGSAAIQSNYNGRVNL